MGVRSLCASSLRLRLVCMFQFDVVGRRSSYRGRLGLGEESGLREGVGEAGGRMYPAPTVLGVGVLLGYVVSQVSCGCMHTLAIAQGRLWAWCVHPALLCAHAVFGCGALFISCRDSGCESALSLDVFDCSCL